MSRRNFVLKAMAGFLLALFGYFIGAGFGEGHKNPPSLDPLPKEKMGEGIVGLTRGMKKGIFNKNVDVRLSAIAKKESPSSKKIKTNARMLDNRPELTFRYDYLKAKELVSQGKPIFGIGPMSAPTIPSTPEDAMGRKKFNPEGKTLTQMEKEGLRQLLNEERLRIRVAREAEYLIRLRALSELEERRDFRAYEGIPDKLAKEMAKSLTAKDNDYAVRP
ncbi:MAG TPA: hypothetical protein ENK02_11240, partial [Planctomycetes bacterium]|nr:hypothetical protein [Planctomycetota bacterium]